MMYPVKTTLLPNLIIHYCSASRRHIMFEMLGRAVLH